MKNNQTIELPECYYLPFPKDMTAVGIFVKAKVIENTDGEWKIYFNLKLINEEDITKRERKTPTKNKSFFMEGLEQDMGLKAEDVKEKIEEFKEKEAKEKARLKFIEDSYKQSGDMGYSAEGGFLVSRCVCGEFTTPYWECHNCGSDEHV